MADVENKPVLPAHDSQQQDSQQQESQDINDKETQSKSQELGGAEIEAAAFSTLKARNDNKKNGSTKDHNTSEGAPQTKAKAKAKGKAKAKATASAKSQQGKSKGTCKGLGKACVKKRPAACQPNTHNKKCKLALVDYEPGMPDPAVWTGRSRESWTSKHYHAARGKAFAAGYSDAEAREIARLAQCQGKVHMG